MLPTHHSGRCAVVVSSRARSSAYEMLQRSGDFARVDRVASGIDALQVATVYARIDLMVIEGLMPGLVALEVARAVHQLRPRTRIVLSTPRLEDDDLVAALRAGVDMVLPDDGDMVRLMTVVRRLQAGEPVVRDLLAERPMVTARLVALAADAPAEERTDPLAIGVSPRELAVLDGVLQGLGNRDIANRLCLSEQTIKNHITSLYRKLGQTERMQVLRFAASCGWVRFDQPRVSPMVRQVVASAAVLAPTLAMA